MALGLCHCVDLALFYCNHIFSMFFMYKFTQMVRVTRRNGLYMGKLFLKSSLELSIEQRVFKYYQDFQRMTFC